MMATRQIPVQLFLADKDPIIDLKAISAFQEAYPWIVCRYAVGGGRLHHQSRVERIGMTPRIQA